MMIRTAVLCGIAALAVNPSAHAQCAYSSRTFCPNRAVQVLRPILPVLEVPPTPDQITFGGFAHVDALASELETLMTELCLDLYYNYSHNYGFKATYTEAYQLLLDAKAIHSAHHHHNKAAIQQRLAGADALFHHVEDDVRGWSRVPYRQIGTLGIITKMQLAENALHHLMEDVGVQSAPTAPPAPETLSSQVPPPSTVRAHYR